MFTTVLIANRGEIALRVARACRELGIRTVAVHSTADRDSAVVRFADEAVHIGPPPAKRSYLAAAAIVEAARQTGADAIHPGYGFLSEDPDFAEICAANGIAFIGTPPQVMAQLGDKARARALMNAAGIPVLPGSPCVMDDGEAQAIAHEIGYPVMIKAVAGGGGRGIRVVGHERDFASAYAQTRAIARAMCGDPRVYLERYVDDARHVEIQVLCDVHGNAIHLGERDCSVQRLHQKLVEESPAPGIPAELAARMAEAAVRGARAVGYVGVGTLEFLVDERGDFHFLEINCRIQVEHPVTEMVTGVDLVHEQLRVAAGSALSMRQTDVDRRGAAIECRINAENPDRDFIPTPGTVTTFVPPGGPFTRVDTHVFPGYRMGSDYDSLLAKVIVWAPDREQALARMRRALGEFQVQGAGMSTTRGFLAEVLSHPLFVDGKHTTSLVERMMPGRRSAVAVPGS